jgi:hypothetical protein
MVSVKTYERKTKKGRLTTVKGHTREQPRPLPKTFKSYDLATKYAKKTGGKISGHPKFIEAWTKDKRKGDLGVVSPFEVVHFSDLNPVEQKWYSFQRKNGLTHEEALTVLINTVEGDVTQLSYPLSEVAEDNKKYIERINKQIIEGAGKHKELKEKQQMAQQNP